VARLQFILKMIHVRDDEDFLGSGGLFLFADLCGDSGTNPYTRPFTCGPGGSIAMEYRFSAGFASPTSR
jgi:hypothetical protein